MEFEADVTMDLPSSRGYGSDKVNGVTENCLTDPSYHCNQNWEIINVLSPFQNYSVLLGVG